MHAAALKTDNQQGPTMQHRVRCSASRGGPGGRDWGGAHSCVCLAESLPVRLKLPQHR